METQSLEKVIILLAEATKATALLNVIGIYMLIGIAIVDAIGLVMLWKVFRDTREIKSKIEN